MSGFEIAGVFLGAVPIIVEALKCYQQSADAFQRWRRYGRDVKILIRNLETERVKMENVCEKLLLGLVPSRQMEEMIGNPFGPSWKDPELWGQIRLRLWNAGKIFEETVQDMKEAIEELMLKLGIESDGKVKWLEQGGIKREMNRAAFVFQRPAYKELLTRIRDGVTNLESLTKSNTELEPERRLRSHHRLSSIIREIASCAYDAFRSTFICACPRPHDVGLKLDPPSTTIVPGDPDDDVVRSVQLHFLVSQCGAPGAAERRRRQWTGFSVRPCSSAPKMAMKRTNTWRKSVKFSSVVQNTSSNLSSTSSQTLVMQPSFSSLSLSCSSTSTTPAVTESILDFCETVRRAEKRLMGDSCGQFIGSTAETSHKCDVFLVNGLDCGDETDWPFSSLGDILQEPSGSPMTFSYEDKLRIALLIASGALQLHGTPWMPTGLHHRDIFVPRMLGPRTERRQEAYLLRHFPDTSQQELPGVGSSGPCSSPESLLSLAAILVRLMIGSVIPDLIKASGCSTLEECLADDIVTGRLVGRLTAVAGEGYAAAVKRCVKGHLMAHGGSANAIVEIVGFLEEDVRFATLNK